jgi:hypothetical protein
LLQIQRWNTAQAIEPNYSDVEVIEVIRFGCALSIFSAVSIAESVAGSDELAQEFLSKVKEIAA